MKPAIGQRLPGTQRATAASRVKMHGSCGPSNQTKPVALECGQTAWGRVVFWICGWSSAPCELQPLSHAEVTGAHESSHGESNACVEIIWLGGPTWVPQSSLIAAVLVA